eukprot:7312940-Pyramimonas_sp.AAC.1
MADEGVGGRQVVGQEKLVKTVSVGVLVLLEALVTDGRAGDVTCPGACIEEDDAHLVLLGGLRELLPVEVLLGREGLRVRSVGDGKHLVEARGCNPNYKEPGVLYDDCELVGFEVELPFAALAVGFAEQSV